MGDDYKRKVIDYRNHREALRLFFAPLPEDDSSSDYSDRDEHLGGANLIAPWEKGHRMSEVWGEGIGEEDDDSDSRRESKVRELMEEQAECLKALKDTQVPEHPCYVSYIPPAKDERCYEDMVSRCMKDPENTYPLHDGKAAVLGGKAPRKNSSSSNGSDALDFLFDKDDGDENLEIEPSSVAAFPRPPVEAPAFGGL